MVFYTHLVNKIYMENITKKYISYNNRKNYLTNNYLKNIFINNKIKKHNNNYIEKERIKLSSNLTEEQKNAVVIDEDNTLVISSAGCGKTFTIVSKIDYLINEKNINEKEILCISFTNKSVEDLKQKIKYNVDIFTFHKLSIEILKDYNFQINICEGDYLEYIVNEVLYNYNLNNRLIIDFINYFILFEKEETKVFKKKNKMLLLIFYLYKIYISEKESSNLLDFNDLIKKSNDYINKYGLKRYYKYIIIDEYQDISNDKYKLINSIKNVCNSHLFCVGDDYQSIYNFSGSDLDLILKFKKMFGYTKVLFLTKTFRCPYELTELSTRFILKNKKQIRKKVISDRRIKKPVKIIYYDKNIIIKFKKIVLIFDKVLILIRNKNDIYLLKDKDIIINDNYIIFNNKRIEYMTVHKSKGLEEDNIIIINLENKINGFPSLIKRDKLLNLVYKEKNKMEEERRLFYVALTRSKNYVFLFVDKNNPSIFIKEILKESKNNIEVLDL